MTGLASNEPAVLARQEPKRAASASMAIRDGAALDAMWLLAWRRIGPARPRLRGGPAPGRRHRTCPRRRGLPPADVVYRPAPDTCREPDRRRVMPEPVDLAIMSGGSIACGVSGAFSGSGCGMVRQLIEDPA
jgi:hypothetical protein